MFQKILLPLALGESPRRVKGIGEFLAPFDTRELVILHAGKSEERSSRRLLSRIPPYTELFEDYPFETNPLFAAGEEADAILETAKGEGADAVIFPWKKKTPLQRVLLGSVTRDVIRFSRRPVLVYKHRRFTADRDNRCRHILFATDFSGSDTDILPYLKQNTLQAETLTILNVRDRAPDPEADAQREEEAMNNLTALKEACSPAYQEVAVDALTGIARKVVLREAFRRNIDLILLGKHDADTPLLRMMGTTAEAITHRSRCSLLIIPQLAKRGPQ